MATYADAKIARRLIYDVAGFNNQLINLLAAIMSIRADFVALSAARKDEIRTAIADQGYSAAEIESLVGKWAAVDAEKNTQGLTAVVQP